jgi:hypothetical protein
VLGTCRIEYTHALISELEGRSEYRAWGREGQEKDGRNERKIRDLKKKRVNK